MKECRFCGGDLSVAEHLDQNHKWGNCIDVHPFLFESDKTTEKLTVKDVIMEYNMNALNAHEQAILAYAKATDDVLEVLTDFGFLTETPFDETELKVKIMSAIQKNIEGNTTYGPAIR